MQGFSGSSMDFLAIFCHPQSLGEESNRAEAAFRGAQAPYRFSAELLLEASF